MSRKQLVALCLCVASFGIVLPVTAGAGEYYVVTRYGDGYYRAGYHSGTNVWYSSTCCYKRVTRHESHYVRVDPYSHRHAYYQHERYGDDIGYRYPRYSGYYRPRSYYPTSSEYDAYDAAAVDGCVVRRVRVADGRGGWIWGTASRCY